MDAVMRCPVSHLRGARGGLHCASDGVAQSSERASERQERPASQGERVTAIAQLESRAKDRGRGVRATSFLINHQGLKYVLSILRSVHPVHDKITTTSTPM